MAGKPRARAVRVVQDPDYGPIEVPPDQTPEEWERQRRVGEELLAASLRARFWPPGSVSACARCGRRTFAGRDDIVHKVLTPGALLVFTDAKGGECSNCGYQRLENSELVRVQKASGAWDPPDFEGRVSSYGRDTLGTYWPRDVVRNLRLAAGMNAYIQVIDQRTVLVRFETPPSREPGGAEDARAPTGRARRSVR